ncbi:glycerophosphodiester phosphodiesterase [Microlunatus sp. Y2014]|uniref:glycerophosphodiester phosphodiesterase n=1 Tax=Microlunatus sp. Y2014 TaxID=3418488 RepID=UPI003DA74BC0
MTGSESTGIGRRSLLAAGLLTGAAGLVGCTPTGSEPSGAAAAPVPDVATLLGLDRFVVAHRGSGDNWPEHTLAAYRAALTAGAQAVEISVRATADGQLVCHHDADLVRTCGVKARVADTAFADLPPVNARRWLGPATRIEPISTLAEVLAALPPDTLAFVEDKDGTNTGALLDLLDAQPRATDRFVWKQWAPAEQAARARSRGYRTWGYLGNDELDRMSEVAEGFDCLGVQVEASDDDLRAATRFDRPVMAWAVHTRSQAARLAALGIAGLMCSNVPYVVGPPRPATIDGFDTGHRSAGDLPRGAGDLWQRQPRLVDDALRFTGESSSSYLLGSLAPLPERCTISVRLGWPGQPSGTVGLAFGLPDDADYDPTSSGNAGGAHRLGLNERDRLAVWDHSAGRTPARVWFPGTTVAPTNGSAMLQLWLDDRTWTARLGDGLELTFPRLHLGSYLWAWAERPGSGASISELRIG